ncbi:DUF4386 family protein [bacterium]|nr:DUF4386 family protein [bacterium]
MDKQNAFSTHSSWNHYYKLCGVTTLLMMILFLFDVIIWSVFGPYPDSAEGWFNLLQQNRLLGLSLLSFPTLLGIILYYMTFLGLYNLLKKIEPAFASLALLLSFTGLTILIITNMAYPLVQLNDQYGSATSEAQKMLLITAGEIKIVTAVTGSKIGGFFAEGAAVIFSILMFKDPVFGKTAGWLGVIGHGLDFIRIIMTLTFLPENIGAILLMIGGLPQFIWLIIVGIKFIHLGQLKRAPATIVN